MPTLNDIETEILNVLTAIDDADLPEERRAELERAAVPYLEELVAQEKSKADAIAYLDRKTRHEIDFLKAEEERLRARRLVLEERRERFRGHVRDVMLRHGLKRLPGRESVLSVRRTERVEIDVPPQELPAEFVEMRLDYVPRKDALKEALRRGEETPGARLAERHWLVIE